MNENFKMDLNSNYLIYTKFINCIIKIIVIISVKKIVNNERKFVLLIFFPYPYISFLIYS